MKVVILSGGLGTRLREETEFKPKPMLQIGENPILWHIMKSYSCYGHKDFVLCLGYKGEIIRDYFFNYDLHHSSVMLELGTKKVLKINSEHDERDWKLWMVDTGQDTLTGGRLKRVQKYISDDVFMVTYGDGVADINIQKLLEFHYSHGKLATVTAVRPSSRFGELTIEGNQVKSFREKPQVQAGWINGGFFVFQKEAFDFLSGDQESLEQGLLEKLTGKNELAVFLHDGFWQCMDTYREMQLLNDLWKQKKAPWKIW
ncbi:MAG: glucose-1-phosphate cytidylyltransferase [Nitrospiria bacterium]